MVFTRLQFAFIGIVCFLTIKSSAQNDAIWIAPDKAKSLVNPIKASDYDYSLDEGKYQYTSNCASCHGELGLGDGEKAKKFNPPPIDFTSKSFQSQTDGEIFWKINEGRGKMPKYKNEFSEEDIWFMVNYIRTLAKK